MWRYSARAMVPTPFTAIARVVKTHGVAGEISCAELEGPLNELPEGLEVWFVPPPDRIRSGHVDSVRPGPKGPLVTVREIGTIDAARAVQGCVLLASTADLPAGWLAAEAPSPVGLRVDDTDRGYIGEISDVIVTGANDVWVITGGPFGQVLVPVIADVVLEVDDDARHVTVRLLPGLIDED